MLKEKLMQDLKEAMKEKNQVKKDTVQMIRAAILQIEKDNNKELDDNTIIEIIAKEIKRKRNVLVDFEKGERSDLIAQTNREIEILSRYLPKQLTKEEINEIVSEIISNIGATSLKDIGSVMKEAKLKIGVGADGKTINEVIRNLLGEIQE